MIIERWADRAALEAHFVIPESRAFAKALARLASETPDLQIYDAKEITA